MSIAPALPPPTSLPPPTGAAPPGAPPGASPFHSALEEELARTAPAEGQHKEGHEKAGEAGAETKRGPSHAHRHQSGEQGRPPAVVAELPGAVTAAPAHEPADRVPVTAETSAASPPSPATGSAPDPPVSKSVSPEGSAAIPKRGVSAPDSAQPSIETPQASGEQPTDGGSPSQAPMPGDASLGIQVSGRTARMTGLSLRDAAKDEDDVRTRAVRSPQTSAAREATAHAVRASKLSRALRRSKE